MGMPRLLEQERAQYALQCIDQVKGDQDIAPKYQGYVRDLPAMIQVNGLGQALAKIASDFGSNDSGPAAHRLLEDLRGWLIHRRHIYPESTDLLHALMAGDRATYLRAYEETIGLCNWLKKLADAYIESPRSNP